MRAYTHGGWAHSQRASTTCLTRTKIVFVLLTQTGFKPRVFGSRVLPTEPPRYICTLLLALFVRPRSYSEFTDTKARPMVCAHFRMLVLTSGIISLVISGTAKLFHHSKQVSKSTFSCSTVLEPEFVVTLDFFWYRILLCILSMQLLLYPYVHTNYVLHYRVFCSCTKRAERRLIDDRYYYYYLFEFSDKPAGFMLYIMHPDLI